MAKRPPIPAGLERLVLVEAGHRCAIHACRQVPVEIAHIVPWSRCRAHTFPNLIALCPTCHTRYDKGLIDRRSMQTYKRQAWWRNARYGDLERRLVMRFAADPTFEGWVFAGLRLLLTQLLDDGLLVDSGQSRPPDIHETLRERRFTLTPAGDELVAELRAIRDPGDTSGADHG